MSGGLVSGSALVLAVTAGAGLLGASLPGLLVGPDSRLSGSGAAVGVLFAAAAIAPLAVFLRRASRPRELLLVGTLGVAFGRLGAVLARIVDASVGGLLGWVWGMFFLLVDVAGTGVLLAGVLAGTCMANRRTAGVAGGAMAAGLLLAAPAALGRSVLVVHPPEGWIVLGLAAATVVGAVSARWPEQTAGEQRELLVACAAATPVVGTVAAFVTVAVGGWGWRWDICVLLAGTAAAVAGHGLLGWYVAGGDGARWVVAAGGAAPGLIIFGTAARGSAHALGYIVAAMLAAAATAGHVSRRLPTVRWLEPAGLVAAAAGTVWLAADRNAFGHDAALGLVGAGTCAAVAAALARTVPAGAVLGGATLVLAVGSLGIARVILLDRAPGERFPELDRATVTWSTHMGAAGFTVLAVVALLCLASAGTGPAPAQNRANDRSDVLGP